MSVSLTNYQQLKQRVSRQTRHRDGEFDAFFSQWLNEIIYRVESGNTPLAHTFNPDVEVEVAAGTYDITVSNLIPFHDFTIRRELDGGDYSGNLKRIENVAPVPRRDEDKGEVTAFSLLSSGSSREARLLLYPAPEEDTTLHVSGYFYSVKTAWADSDTAYLIENEPLLLIYGISSLVYEHFGEPALSERSYKMYQRELYGNEAEHGVDGFMIRQQIADVPDGGSAFELSPRFAGLESRSYSGGDRAKAGELRKVEIISPIDGSISPVKVFPSSAQLSAYSPPVGEGWLVFDKATKQLSLRYQESEGSPIEWHTLLTAP